ncbi:Probable cytochrome P450 12b2, mitochondrial [Gryllus bimaculatus]|nr:Probable cytochrome P450 12b2, mitochondrial [Gryllus bimaculatus]
MTTVFPNDSAPLTVSLSTRSCGVADMRHRYGPIVREEALGNVPVVSLFDAEAIEKVARYPSRYPIRPPTEISVVYRASRPDRYTNHGIVNEQGEKWAKLRQSLAKEVERPYTINRFVPDLDLVVQDFISLLRGRRDASNFVPDLELIVKHLGLESSRSMSTLVLGRRIGVLNSNVASADREFGLKLARVVEDHFCACRDSYYGLLPLWKYIPTQTYAQYTKAEDEFYEIISKFVDEALQDEQNTSATEPVKKVFMSILDAKDMAIEDKKSAVIDFIASGLMTMGSTLIFLLYHVAKNPKVQERLYDELISLIPAGESITVKDLLNARYLDAVVKETYRIQPTATSVARILEEEMELSGYHLPAGTVVLCQNWIACTDENNFTHANEFRPERWLPESCAGWKCRENLVAPYGFGVRICPGKRFTHQMLLLLLARMALNFKMEYTGELTTKFEFLVVPKGPINLFLHDRQ